ncbi:hypothetical protein BX616_001778 [Lobosporangium transversale]|nr:hypothetical protein BX616_001778 [Lobosporangium transversale]
MQDLDHTAPSALKVHPFFKSVKARYWHNTHAFFKYCDLSKPSEQHFTTYTKGLTTISNANNVSESLRSRADNVLQKASKDPFTQAFEEYINKKNASDAKRKISSTILKVVKSGASDAEKIVELSSVSHKKKRLDICLDSESIVERESSVSMEASSSSWTAKSLLAKGKSSLTSAPPVLDNQLDDQQTEYILPSKDFEGFQDHDLAENWPACSRTGPPPSPKKSKSFPISMKKRRQSVSTTSSEPATPKLKLREPWHSLVDLAILMYTDWDVELPSIDLDQSVLDEIGSKNKEILYRIGLRNLHQAQLLHKLKSLDKNHCLPYKDAFVALSGIWNLYSTDANNSFGSEKLKAAQGLCLLPGLEERTQGIDEIVQRLLGKVEEGSSVQDLLNYTYALQCEYPEQRRRINVLQHLFSHAIRPLTGNKKPSEGDVMLLWGCIFKDGLPLDTQLCLHLGEQGCAATTLSKSMLAEAFNTGCNTRKCDCLLTVDGMEVGNFEAKRGSCGPIDVAVQLRKNAKINKSILLELEKHGIGCPPLLNIQGTTATVIKIIKYEDIWVVGKACSPLVLPVASEDIQFFLQHGVFVLFNLLDEYHAYAQKAYAAKRLYEYNNRVMVEDIAVGVDLKSPMMVLEWERVVFHSPTKPRTRKSSLLQELAAAQDESDKEEET